MNVAVLRCGSCGRLEVPPAYICSSCGSRVLNGCEVPGEGVLYTYSTVYAPLAAFEDDAPYTLAIVELLDGVRVTGRVVGAEPGELAVGMELETVEKKGGSYLFRPKRG